MPPYAYTDVVYILHVMCVCSCLIATANVLNDLNVDPRDPRGLSSNIVATWKADIKDARRHNPIDKCCGAHTHLKHIRIHLYTAICVRVHEDGIYKQGYTFLCTNIRVFLTYMINACRRLDSAHRKNSRQNSDTRDWEKTDDDDVWCWCACCVRSRSSPEGKGIYTYRIHTWKRCALLYVTSRRT